MSSRLFRKLFLLGNYFEEVKKAWCMEHFCLTCTWMLHDDWQILVFQSQCN